MNLVKAYNFSMEKVLEWRENKEKTSMEKFAIQLNELLQEKTTLANLMKEYEMIKEKSLCYKNINELRQTQLYKQTIEDKMEYQNQIIEEKSNLLEELRLELIVAQKDRKVMEKLKEKDYSDYQDELKASEQKDLDEVAVLKYKKFEN